MSRSLILALRSLCERPSRTVLTTFGIVLGVAVILAISITNKSTLESIQTLFGESSGKVHLMVISSNSNNQGFREDLQARVANVPGVNHVIPSLHAQAVLASEAAPSQVGISLFGTVEGGLALYGIDPALDPKAREYKVVAGEFLPHTLDSYDLVLVKDYANEKQIQLGKEVALVTPSGTQKLRVVGLMSKQGPGTLNNGAFGVLPLRAAQKIFERGNEIDQIDVVALPEAANGTALDSLQANLQAKLGRDYSVVYPAAQGKRVTQMLDYYELGLNFFSVIALFVGAFLIYNAFSMTVVERTREIGMLRTIGMSQGQVIGQILTEAAILGVLGSIIGVGLGILLSGGMMRVSEILFAQEIKQVRISPVNLVLIALVGILVALAAALLPALQASRISPLEALRVRGANREAWLVRHGWRLGIALLVISYLALYHNPFPSAIRYWTYNAAVFTMFFGATLVIPATVAPWEALARPWLQRIYGREGQLGSRNTQRAKWRTALTVGALMVGVAMILSISSLTTSFEHDIRAWVDTYMGGDLYVHSTLPLRSDLELRLKAIPGVAAVTPVRFFDIKWTRADGTNENVAFMAVDPESYCRVTSFSFAANQGDPNALLDRLAAGNTVFVSSVMAERNGFKQGDNLYLETKHGKQVFEIAAIVVDFYNLGLVIEGSWRDMHRYFGIDNVSGYFLKTQPGISSDEVQKRIDTLYGKSRHLTIESNKSLKSRVLNLMAQSSSLFDVLALIAMLVSALGVVNTMTMNVMERIKEIGMLRSLGMTRWQVSKMILAEAGLMGLAGGVYGLLFGLFLSRVLLMALDAIHGYDLTYVVPMQGIIISLLIALLVSQLAAIWPARRASGVRLVETIHFE